MGTEVWIFAGEEPGGAPEGESVLSEAEAELLEFDRRLSRFRPDSELSRFNESPRVRRDSNL